MKVAFGNEGPQQHDLSLAVTERQGEKILRPGAAALMVSYGLNLVGEC